MIQFTLSTLYAYVVSMFCIPNLTNTCKLVCFQAHVDAPNMVRCQMNFKKLELTDIKIDIKRIPKKRTLIEAMEAAGIISSAHLSVCEGGIHSS